MDTELDPSVFDREWPNMVDGAVEDPLRGRLLAYLGERVNSAMSRELDTAELYESLGRVLDVPLLSGSAWPEVDRCVGLALGRAGVRLLTWLVAIDVELESRMDEVADVLGTEAERLFRGIMVRHGDELSRAYYMWNFLAADDDWRTVNWEIFQAVGTDRYSVRMSIRKFNGEQLFFTGRPDSTITFVRVLCDAVTSLPTAAFGNRDEIDRLRQALRALVEKTGDSAERNADGDVSLSR